MSPLGGEIELYGSSSCVGVLRSWLNAEGILTLPMFLLGDGSLITNVNVLLLLDGVGCCCLFLLL